MEQRYILSPGEPDGLTVDAIRRRLADRARQRLPADPPRSDESTARTLAGEVLPIAEAKPTVPASVLVPLVAREIGLQVLLTRRTAHLDHHAGQISFPGGRMEPEDSDAVACALREAREEIGIDPAHVEVIGRLDDYVTVTGFRVAPIVALLRPPFELRPDPFEVAEVFEVPLAFILDPANHLHHCRDAPDGRRRYFYAMPYGRHYIWGATAAMLVNLWEAFTRPGEALVRPKEPT